MKIIFLDVDGVLNSDSFADEVLPNGKRRGWGGYLKEDEPATDDNVKWDKNCVDRLKHIVYSTGADIVISSTWRKFFSVEKFKEMFAVYGWDLAPVIDKTRPREKLSEGRGTQIEDWLLQHPEVIKYVIIDDMPDFHEYQDKYFVNTYFQEGLQDVDVEKAITILNS